MSAILWTSAGEMPPPPHFEERLCAALKGRVDRAFLFGSYGTESFGPASDIDVILVCDTRLPFVERPRLFEDLYRIHPRLDLLVYTEQELAEQMSETVGFWASAQKTMRELALD